MNTSVRTFLSPIAGIMTLAIGVGLVAVIQMCISLLTRPTDVAPSVERTDALIAKSVDRVETTKLELSCYDPNILPVWRELKEDNEFRARLAEFPDSYDCSDLFEVQRINLHQQGEVEYLVSGKEVRLFCGSKGNCERWVFGRRNGKFVRLLHSAGIRLEVTDRKQYGFRNLVVRFNHGVYPDSLLEYRFDGSEYELSRCYDQDKQTLETWRESCDGW